MADCDRPGSLDGQVESHRLGLVDGKRACAIQPDGCELMRPDGNLDRAGALAGVAAAPTRGILANDQGLALDFDGHAVERRKRTVRPGERSDADRQLDPIGTVYADPVEVADGEIALRGRGRRSDD